MRWAFLLATLLGAARAAPECGGDDEDGGKPGPDPVANRSSLTCLERSTLSPEIYEDGKSDEAGIQPLLRDGAKGAEILTGKVAAVVIEYPTNEAAVGAFHAALESKVLKKYVKQRQIQAFERTLIIDYTEEPHVKRVVIGCATRPDQAPQT